MLSAIDDLPRHQIVDSMVHVDSTDPSWSDGYYFCFWDSDGTVSLASGLRVYHNMDVVDGYVSIMSAGRLKNIRMSRRWSTNYDGLCVGPLSLEIVQGLKERRLRLSACDVHDDLGFDLVWRAVHDPFEEGRRVERVHGRVIRDLKRYWQTGRASGTVSVAGRSILVSPERWYCIMDHSWGTRSSVGTALRPEDFPPVEALPKGRDGLLRIVGFVQMPTYVAFFQTHEDASGATVMVEGRVDYANGKSVVIVSIEHNFKYLPGTRKLEKGDCRVRQLDGSWLQLSLQPTHTPTIVSALGYPFETKGFGDNRGMGVYRGESWVESDEWRHEGAATVDPAGSRYPYNGYIGPVAVRNGSEVGMGYFETVIIGAYARYGMVAEGPVPITVLPIA